MICAGHQKYILGISTTFSTQPGLAGVCNRFHFTFATQLFCLKAFFFFIFFLFPFLSQAQTPGSVALPLPIDSPPAAKDSTAGISDSVIAPKGSITTSILNQHSGYRGIIQRALQQSKFLHSSPAPSQRVSRVHGYMFNDILFYLVLALLIFFAFLRFLYERYFNNLFRVFFNTSLRQSQLADQLLQARQVSLLFNVLFVLTGGLYIYFLLVHFKWVHSHSPVLAISLCTLSLAVVYFAKYASLLFTGWITGYSQASNTYLFIIFLINKILGVLLIPFIIVIAFGKSFLQYPAVLLSLLLIGLMFLLRFLRSYGLLRKDIKVSRFHFFVYILGVEVLPLLLIYKSVVVLFGKNG